MICFTLVNSNLTYVMLRLSSLVIFKVICHELQHGMKLIYLVLLNATFFLNQHSWVVKSLFAMIYRNNVVLSLHSFSVPFNISTLCTTMMAVVEDIGLDSRCFHKSFNSLFSSLLDWFPTNYRESFCSAI